MTTFLGLMLMIAGISAAGWALFNYIMCDDTKEGDDMLVKHHVRLASLFALLALPAGVWFRSISDASMFEFIVRALSL